jgi:hypothetical protein
VAPTLDELMRSCERSAVHLELRDGYTRDDPMLTAWLAGERLDPADRASWWNSWLELVADSVARGVEVRRARIVSEPVSEYVRYEYDVTFRNIIAGERVRWLPRRLATDLALPGNDFWLFDEGTLLVNHFSGEGDKVGVDLFRGQAVVKLCASAFEATWERATPHDDYRPA